MAISQAKSKRSPSGGRYIDFRKKKQFESGREPSLTKIGKVHRNVLRTMGGNQKVVVLNIDVANVLDKKTHKSMVAKIVTVKSNPANPNYVRRNIITKGCTITTDKGVVLVTSRPGQDGTVNGVLI